MANRVTDRSFFTNSYITGKGRQNYLRIDDLEDPLFTSFTFDIDFVSSPLFYTINYSDYGYPVVEGIGNKIENALEKMYSDEITGDGYDILPMLSASILDGNKLGFGLQQNVYMDKPLYGATEYIYMVDKRNGSADQNDVRHDSNIFEDFTGSNPNWLNSYKLGDSVKSIVNKSDEEWAKKNKQINEDQIAVCNDIMKETYNEHKENVKLYEELKQRYESVTHEVEENNDGAVVKVQYTEAQLQQKVDKYTNQENEFEQFKKEISDWVNSELSKYQDRLTKVYANNKCIQKITTYSDIAFCDDDKKDAYKSELKKLYGDNYVNEYISGGNNSYLNNFETIYKDLEKFVTLDMKSGRGDVNEKMLVDKFKQKLEQYKLYENEHLKGKVQAIELKAYPDWLIKVNDGLPAFVNDTDKIDKTKSLMGLQCDSDTSFVDFDSTFTNDNENELSKYGGALDEVKFELYGKTEGDKSDYTSDSLYAQYLEAKEKVENDDYARAERAKALAESGKTEMNNMLSIYNRDQSLLDAEYEASTTYIKDPQPVLVDRHKSIVVSQTVLDMLGFISGMKRMTLDYPYIIQGITGLDTAYNKHYGIKDPYLGSGEDKITLTCLESLDLRVSSMFNRYFNAVYDRQYRRERVPVNLRRFNCFIYVHDVRNFVSNIRRNSDGVISSYNRILELTDMYYSVIEFRFYDCEIVPEETGNIFNDVSNEAPSEMKKTNFTFTYGNCVVNFIPHSEVASHDNKTV